MPYKEIKVYISGVHSGVNPLPGIGIARSLAAAFHNIRLIPVDYSKNSSGLYWEGFRDPIVLPPWATKTPSDHLGLVESILADQNSYWISCLDLEVSILSHASPTNRILSPTNSNALRLAAKPCTEAATLLDFERPHICSLDASNAGQDKAHEFLVANGWRCWLKPPNYGAFPVRSWPELQISMSAAREIWGDVPMFLENHIDGEFISFAFSAFDGELLDAVSMKKKDITAEGKTWSGQIFNVDQGIYDSIQSFCKSNRWTGGAELECIRSYSGEYFLLEINPRFPAWIHGASYAGKNLPAALLNRALGNTSQRSGKVHMTEFTRIVLEVPKDIHVACEEHSDIHHPSGMPSLTRRMMPSTSGAMTNCREHQDCDCEYELLSDDFSSFDPLTLLGLAATPQYWINSRGVEKRILEASDWARNLGESAPNVRMAYSCKTNSDNAILRSVERSGWMVDAISLREVTRCLQAGFSPERIILNGPAKFWPDTLLEQYAEFQFFAFHFDSDTEANRYLTAKRMSYPSAGYLGLRVRPTGTESRFGLLVEKGIESTFVGLLKRLHERTRVSLHLHIAQSRIGVYWFDILDRVVSYVESIHKELSFPIINLVDLGGGWTSEGWLVNVMGGSPYIIKALRRLRIAGVSEVVFEPGKSIVEREGFLVSRVLDRRVVGSQLELVVDASLIMMPDWVTHPHQLAFFQADGTRLLAAKSVSGHVYGRTCMETDILATNAGIPTGISVGDFLVWSRCGAYDESLSVPFGIGLDGNSHYRNYRIREDIP